MNCPTCNVWTSVVATVNKQTHTQRRRECANGHKFTTHETVVTGYTHGGDRKSQQHRENKTKEKVNVHPVPL